ncbi:Malonyl-CoA decarboxylase [Azonexus hydrophilus]|uniref:Malonyl-CoA decarboxylase n=1 Tax=Azonexus hydrophilus TaxID=418702 RepID=A0A1R1I8L3_9RHOO|nr:malonyl-CoA decarboxylase [Azonexus hydrophilus]OMG55052.1 Malonyl-CoA decarboxylase [Azonexus hydrophilus]
MTNDSLVGRLRSLIAPDERRSALTAKGLERLRAQLRECAAGQGGEVSARTRAARLAETYLGLDDAGRQQFLKLIALEFGPDPAKVAAAHADYQAAVGTPGQWKAEAALRTAMRSTRIRIMTQFNAIPQGVKFLVDLRADLLRYLADDRELAVLDRELESRLNAWFDVGFLELQRLTWNSPAALLEKLIEYEAVHAIQSWTDLKNRLDSDRRLYAFFHPRMPAEPLIFVEVALTDHLAGNVQELLDVHAPLFDHRKADTAIFYSISSTQVGLRGVSFGSFLLKRVIDDLKRDFPKLDKFATLSPIPALASWLRHNPQALGEAGIDFSLAQLASGEWANDREIARQLRDPLTRLAARYLTSAKRGGQEDGPPYDPVSRFHLGNGARIEHLNYLADTSAKGFAQSFGLMVNYRYQLEDLEGNLEAFASSGRIAMSSAIRRLARVQ